MYQQELEDRKKMKIKKIIAIISTFYLASCAKKEEEFIRMPEEVKEEIKIFDVVIPRCQKTLEAAVHRSNISAYTNGGLLFALIDDSITESRQKDANKALEVVYQEIKEIDMESLLAEEIIPEFKNANWKGLKHVVFLPDNEKENCDKSFESLKSDGVMFIRFRYELSPDFKTLTGILYVIMYPNSQKIKSLIKDEKYPIYKTHIAASDTLKYAHTNKEENAKAWGDQNGKLIKEGIKKVIKELKAGLQKKLEHSHL